MVQTMFFVIEIIDMNAFDKSFMDILSGEFNLIFI